MLLSRVIHRTSDDNIWDCPADFIDLAAQIIDSDRVIDADSSPSTASQPIHELRFESTPGIFGANPVVLPLLSHGNSRTLPGNNPIRYEFS